MTIHKSIIVDFYRKPIFIEVTSFFLIDFYRLISEVDINFRLLLTTNDCYR